MQGTNICSTEDSNSFYKYTITTSHHCNPRSIAFFNDMGFDSITVPPHGLPVARISAAQAEIRRSK